MDRQQQLNISAGKIINGRYEVEKTIGTGSMGVVFRCRDLRADRRPVAMKVLYKEYAQDQVGIARFRNEVIAAYEVMHRNVVQPFDYINEDGLIAYTMEFVDGTDLAEVLAAKEEINISTVIDWLMQMCRGVSAIHRAGIVHRDLKPENVMLSIAGEVKIMDFGIARTMGGRKLTAHGALLGTLEYMSPEYLTDGKVHHLGDIYSLGVIGYELLTNRLPHEAPNLLELVKAKVATNPEPPHVFRPDCPVVLSKMILRMMHNNAAQRYKSAGEVSSALEQLGFAGGEFRTPTAEIARRFLEAQRSSGEIEEQEIAAESLAPETPEPQPIDPYIGMVPDWPEPQSEPMPEPMPEPRRVSKPGPRRIKTPISFAKPRLIEARHQSPLRLGILVLLLLASLTLLSNYYTDGRVFAGTAGLMNSVLGSARAEEQLFKAIEGCNYERAQHALRELPGPNLQAPDGDTPLIRAVRRDCLAIANLLLEQGADLRPRGAEGETALMLAERLNHISVKNLLQYYLLAEEELH